ncbi:MAG: hypothetical protein HIU84_01005 [Acidobacteria bacterium]|nr:hypothetical protein [Acidobacteriota bacterium]
MASKAPLVWGHDAVLTTTVHGVFEDQDVIEVFCAVRPQSVLDTTFDAFADAIEEHLDTQLLRSMVELRP